MKVSIVIPCYNECNTIAEIIEAVRSSCVIDAEIVLVHDGSTDGTWEFIEAHLRDRVDVILFHSRNQGKGSRSSHGFRCRHGGRSHARFMGRRTSPRRLFLAHGRK